MTGDPGSEFVGTTPAAVARGRARSHRRHLALAGPLDYAPLPGGAAAPENGTKLVDACVRKSA